MKSILLVVLALCSFSTFAEGKGNCELIGKLKSHDSVIVMPWIKVAREANVSQLQDCVNLAEKFLAETEDEYEGSTYLGKSSYRVVKFKFSTDTHVVKGKIKNRRK